MECIEKLDDDDADANYDDADANYDDRIAYRARTSK